MGNGERHGRRALVDHAKNAVTLANQCNAAVADAQAKHNELSEYVGANVRELRALLLDLKARADAQRAWLKKVEDAGTARDQRVSLLRSDVAAAVALFRGLTFMDRLRLFCFGTLPVTGDVREFTAAWLVTPPDFEIDKPTTIVVHHTSDVSAASGAHGYIPHASLGPSVLP